jgi:hypothetical protein
MKQLFFVLMTFLCSNNINAQTDSIPRSKKDTLKMGGVTIIINGKDASNDSIQKSNKQLAKIRKVNKLMSNRKYTTSFLNLDLGFNTTYPTTGNYVQNGLTKSSLTLKSGKSIHARLWIIGQRRYLHKKNIALKYALGMEYLNLRYKNGIDYRDQNTSNVPVVSLNTTDVYSKNKLGLTYVTVPLMLHFNVDPHKTKLRFAAGISGGYLVSARNKQVSEAFGKRKNKGDFDLNKFKANVEGELGFSFIKLYGNYSLTKLHNTGLEQQPYALGIRIGGW